MGDYFKLGSRFCTYRELINALSQYCVETKTKFVKDKAVTLSSYFGRDVSMAARKTLIYYEIEFVCHHNELKNKEKVGCPAYYRFRTSSKGAYLELVAMNNRHIHELQETQQTMIEEPELEPLSPRKKRKLSTTDRSFEVIELHIDDSEEEEAISKSEVTFTFRGLIAPTLTPFNDDLSINNDIVPEYAKFLADAGIMGVLVNGTSGEGMSMNVAERKSTAEAWVKAVKQTDQHLMVQIGGAPLPDVLELAKHAEEVGVHSLLCLPDLYNKPATSADLIRYLKLVSDAAPRTPLLYYHIPSYTNVNIHMGKFLDESVDKIPTFHGIKFTSNALDEGVAAVKANNGKYAVFLGADQLLAGAFALGFDSAIATSLNMFPQYGISILEAVRGSNVAEARQAQNILTEICAIVTRNGGWVATMKAAMSLLTPLDVGRAREPLVNLAPEQIKEMELDLKTISE